MKLPTPRGWFGNPQENGLPHVPTPIGEACLWCDEPIQAGDEGYILPFIQRVEDAKATVVTIVPQHEECMLRQVIGSVGHLQQRCSCYLEGAGDGDPDGMTKHEAAKAAAALWRAGVTTERIQ